MKPRNQLALLTLTAAGIACAAVLLLLQGMEQPDPGPEPGDLKPLPVADRAEVNADNTLPPGQDAAESEAEQNAPATTVSGRVLGEDGAPIEGHRVILALPNSDNAPMPHIAALFILAENPRAHSWPDAVTAQDGSFEFSTKRRGTAVLLAGPPAFSGFAEPVQLQGKPVSVELRLGAGLRIAGFVREKDTGLPVRGASVTMIQPATPAAIRRNSTTLDDGRFSAAGFSKGEVRIDVTVPGSEFVDAGWARVVHAKAGDQDVEVPLFRVGMAGFRAVTSPGMEPYGGPLRVMAISEPDSAPVVQHENDGTHTIRGPAGAHVYSLWPRDHAPALASFNIVPGARTERPDPVVFVKGTALEGTVEIPEDPGSPSIPRSAFVYVECLDPPLGRVLMREVRLQGANWGSFEFENLCPGPHRLVAAAGGFGIHRSELTLSGDRCETRITLRKNDASALVAGKPYRERRALVLDVHFADSSNHEAVLLLAAVSGTDLRLLPSPGAASDGKKRDISMHNVRLADAVRSVKNAWKLEFDPESGEFQR